MEIVNKDTLNKIKEDWNFFINNIIKNKKYIYPVVFFCILAYSYNLFNRTIGLDDLAYSMFFNEDHLMISGIRWGLEILELILPNEYTPFVCRFFSVVLLVISGVLFSFLLFSIVKEDNVWLYTIFSCVFVTYPLINEIWEFFSYVYTPFFFILCSIVLLYQMYSDNITAKDIIICGIILSPVMSGGEDVICFYITFVLIILFLKNESNEKGWFFDGLRFSYPLFVALLLRFVIGYSLMYIMNLTYFQVGNENIFWLINIKDSIIRLLYNGWYYIIRGLSYFPITEFVVMIIFFIILSIRRIKLYGYKYVFISFLLILSLFAISIIQGDYLHYRTACTIQAFVAFCSFLIVYETKDKKIKAISIQSITTLLLLVLCLKQSVTMHEILALNNQRSNNEAFVASNIGYELYKNFDINKTVIFCGEYNLGNFIEDQITIKKDSLAYKVESYLRELLGVERGRLYDEYISTNVNSYFNTQLDAFSGQAIIKKYLSYFGYDINVLENLTREEEKKLKGYYEEIAIKENMKTYEIKDMDDYILVFLGPTIDGINAD